MANLDRVDRRLVEVIQRAAERFHGYDVVFKSGYRVNDRRFHGKGAAIDVQLIDRRTGKVVPDYQNSAAFRIYEKFAQTVRQVQQTLFPGLSKDLRWGGYFSGKKGVYGALDLMHFDLAGRRVGMAGGSWEKGLTKQQRKNFPGVESVGLTQAQMNARLPEHFTVPITRAAATRPDNLAAAGPKGQFQVPAETFYAAPVGPVTRGVLGPVMPREARWAPNPTPPSLVNAVAQAPMASPTAPDPARLGQIAMGPVVKQATPAQQAAGYQAYAASRLPSVPTPATAPIPGARPDAVAANVPIPTPRPTLLPTVAPVPGVRPSALPTQVAVPPVRPPAPAQVPVAPKPVATPPPAPTLLTHEFSSGYPTPAPPPRATPMDVYAGRAQAAYSPSGGNWVERDQFGNIAVTNKYGATTIQTPQGQAFGSLNGGQSSSMIPGPLGSKEDEEGKPQGWGKTVGGALIGARAGSAFGLPGLAIGGLLGGMLGREMSKPGGGILGNIGQSMGISRQAQQQQVYAQGFPAPPPHPGGVAPSYRYPDIQSNRSIGDIERDFGKQAADAVRSGGGGLY